MIHVCSLARLHDTVAETGALHVVTLLKDTDLVERPRGIVAANHLILGMDDIAAPIDGYVLPRDEHVTRLIEFVRSRLAHYKAPRSVDFVDELPRDPNGKLYKRALRDQYFVDRPSKIL